MAQVNEFSTSGYNGAGSPDKLDFWWESTQDVAANTSTVTWTVKVGSGWSGYYNTLTKRYIKVGSYEQTRGQDYIDGTALTVYNGTVISDLSGSTTIQHNQDGTGSFTVSLKGMFQYSFVGNNYQYNSTGAKTITLPTIPRKATITSAQDFTDQQSPVITYQNLAGSSASLRIAISLDGTTAATSYRTLPNITSGTYTFELTSEELADLRAATKTSSRSIYFLLETTISSQVYYDAVQKTFTVSNTEDSRPTVTVTATADNSAIPAPVPLALNRKFIQGVSRINYRVQGQAKYSAEIDYVTITLEGYTDTYTPPVRSGSIDYTGLTNTIETSGTIPLTITVTDSRGYSTTVITQISVIPYNIPYLTGASVTRCDVNGVPRNDGQNLLIKARRIFSALEGEGKARIEYRYKRADQSWGSQSWTTIFDYNDQGSPDVNYYEGVVISGTPDYFSKTVAYTVQLRCYDSPMHNSTTLSFDIPTESVVLHLKDGGNGVGIGMYCTASGEMQVGYKAVFEDDVEFGQVAKATLLDMFYPVGTIYTSTNSTSPATLFGGTWTPIEDTFLLAAGQSYTAGDTGGESSHVLTTGELPAHTHGSKSLSGTLYAYSWSNGSASGIVSKAAETVNMGFNSGSQIGHIGYSINATHEHDIVGSGNAHNNMPPYLVVYVWERTA